MVCPHCGSAVGSTGACDRCGGPDDTVTLTGWRRDPAARHEGRYYVAGHPTSRVRNGRAETTDTAGGQMLPGYVEVPSSRRTTARSAWLGTGAATVLIVMLAVVVWALQRPQHHQTATPDANYLSWLRDSGLAGQFNSDANALAHGMQVCRQLEDGGPQQGPASDKIAVDAFCPRFSEGFHILESITASGTFVLTDTNPVGDVTSIATDGASCEGTGGYSDIGSNTQLFVKNGKGEILATTSLGQGRGSEVTCTFSFSFPVTEGQDRYVVSVGRRGEFSYTFGQLQTHGLQIHLGH